MGVDIGVFRGPMTGVGNYTLNILAAALAIDPTIRFRGFQFPGWHSLGRETIAEFARTRDKWLPGLAPRGSGQQATDRARWQIARQLGRFDPVRRMDRVIRAARFRQTVGRQNIDVFYANASLPPADPGVPLLPLVHDLSQVRHPGSHPPERVRWLNQLPEVVERAEIVQTVSEFTKREMVELFGCRADKIFVAPPAASPIFRPIGVAATAHELAPLQLDVGSYILTVGALEPRKNLATLVNAFGALRGEIRQRVPLVVVGIAGWGDLKVPPSFDRMQRDGSLRLVGMVPDSILRSLYEGARLVTMPSIYEGFGMPIVEALACGSPVLHAAGSAMDEVSRECGTALPAYDVAAWTEMLQASIDGDDWSDPVKRAARIERAGTYSWYGSAERLIAALSALGPPAQRGHASGRADRS